MIEAWAILKRLWPLFVIIPLVFAILFMRATIASKQAALDLKTVEAKNLSEANAANAKFIEGLTKQRLDNDAIADAIAARLSVNNTREIHTREVIERAIRDDAKVRDWASVPVPNGVRSALAAPNQD